MDHRFVVKTSSARGLESVVVERPTGAPVDSGLALLQAVLPMLAELDRQARRQRG